MPEIELKLRASPARLKSTFARLSKRAVKGSAFRKQLRAVYFDTAKHDLHAKEISFRIREEDGRFIQTLKRAGDGGEALTRGEWSDEVSAAAPELSHTKTGRKLKQVWKDVRLLPRFRTVIDRHGFVLAPRRGVRIEAVRDQGEIRAIGGEDKSVRVSELELELKAGPPAALYELALEILDNAAVEIEPRAKSDRGYALTLPEARVLAIKAEAPTLSGHEPLAEVLKMAARRHFGQFLANSSGAMAQHPASIHQMRVAMRRLLSALYALRDLLPDEQYDSIRNRLRFLLHSLGPARDWEVLSEHLSDLADDEDDDDIDGVHRAVGMRKRRALDQAAHTVTSRRTTRILLESMLWFETLPQARHGRKLRAPAKQAVRRLLSDLFNRVRRRGREFEQLSIADRHRLRIACKNLRYNVELYSGLFHRRKVQRFLTRLKAVQDDLGHLNDVSRARDLLGGLVVRSPQENVAGAVVMRLEARMAAAEKGARRHVDALRAAKAFW